MCDSRLVRIRDSDRALFRFLAEHPAITSSAAMTLFSVGGEHHGYKRLKVLKEAKFLNMKVYSGQGYGSVRRGRSYLFHLGTKGLRELGSGCTKLPSFQEKYYWLYYYCSCFFERLFIAGLPLGSFINGTSYKRLRGIENGVSLHAVLRNGDIYYGVAFMRTRLDRDSVRPSVKTYGSVSIRGYNHKYVILSQRRHYGHALKNILGPENVYATHLLSYERSVSVLVNLFYNPRYYLELLASMVSGGYLERGGRTSSFDYVTRVGGREVGLLEFASGDVSVYRSLWDESRTHLAYVLIFPEQRFLLPVRPNYCYVEVPVRAFEEGVVLC